MKEVVLSKAIRKILKELNEIGIKDLQILEGVGLHIIGNYKGYEIEIIYDGERFAITSVKKGGFVVYENIDGLLFPDLTVQDLIDLTRKVIIPYLDNLEYEIQKEIEKRIENYFSKGLNVLQDEVESFFTDIEVETKVKENIKS
jgi:hypothetical protein